MSAVFSDDFYFTTSVFEGELVCVRVQRQCIYTDVLLRGSSLEMQCGSQLCFPLAELEKLRSALETG